MITGFISRLSSGVKSYVNGYVQQSAQKTIQVKNDAKFAELYFERDYRIQDTWDQADAILTHVLKIPEARTVWVVGQLEIVKNGYEFSIAPNVKFQLLETKVDNKGSLEHVSFKLCSETLTVCELRNYVNGLAEEYLINKKNNLGDKTFYFDHIVEKTNSRNPTPPQKVLFSKHLFCTNRTLDNVFHERQQELKQRVEFFLTRKDWYDKRGIPHTLGLLLHGTPGTGKTTTIKAIANIAKRHIVNINLGAIKTKKQLKKLFYDEKLEICENMSNTNNVSEYIIPIDRRLYVIEDIDAIDSELVLRRSRENTVTYIEEHQPDDTQDLDLSTLLNIIDGTLETPGRILIISSNYPEKLDEALIRPGRIDMLLEYKKCNHKMLHDMFVSFFETEPDSDVIVNIPEYTWTPAEVCQLLFKNFGEPDTALRELVEIDPKEYFKFSHIDRTDRHPIQPGQPQPQQQQPQPEQQPHPQQQSQPQQPQPQSEPPQPQSEPPQPQSEPPQPQQETIQPLIPINQQQQEIDEQLSEERSSAVVDMMSENDMIQHLDGVPIQNILQQNTHENTYTLQTGYAPSQSGYAFAGLN